MVGFVRGRRFMINPPGILSTCCLSNVPNDGTARLHSTVFPRAIGVNMTVIVERLDQFGTDEAPEGEREGAHPVIEIRLEGPHLVGAIVVLPETQSSTVAPLGNRLTADIAALPDIHHGVGERQRRELEDTAVKRHVVPDIDFLGIDIDVTRDLAEVFFVVRRAIPVVPHHVFDVDLGSKRVHGLVGAAAHEQFRFFIRIVIVPDDIPMPVILADSRARVRIEHVSAKSRKPVVVQEKLAVIIIGMNVLPQAVRILAVYVRAGHIGMRFDMVVQLVRVVALDEQAQGVAERLEIRAIPALIGKPIGGNPSYPSVCEAAAVVIRTLCSVWMRNAMCVAVGSEAAAEIIRIRLRADVLTAKPQFLCHGRPCRHRAEASNDRQRREQPAAREGNVFIRVFCEILTVALTHRYPPSH